jgi:hypothetical protein
MYDIFNVHNSPRMDLNWNNVDANGYLDTIINQKHKLLILQYLVIFKTWPFWGHVGICS